MRRALVGLALGAAGCSEYVLEGPLEELPSYANAQPLDGSVQVDRILQVGETVVDVLWVVDNSCSMWDEQEAIGIHFPAFMGYFIGAGLDFHIGVVSTDMEDPAHQGRLRQVDGYRYIDEATPDPVGTFSAMAAMGTEGTWDEEGFAATNAAVELEGDGYNAGFLRSNSAFHVVVISDENDYSEEWTSTEFTGWLGGLRGADSLVGFSSIVGPEATCPGASEPGTDYLAVTRAVGGVEWSICDADWEVVLDRLGLEATQLTREFYLSRLPAVGTLRVEVVAEGVTFAFEEGLDWTYDASRNSVTFTTYVPPALAEVRLAYEVAVDATDAGQ